VPFILSSGGAFHPGFSFDFANNFVKINPVVYYVLNLGLPLLLAIVSVIKKGNWLLKGTFVLLLLIPNLVVFTPNSWDMYKLFMFAWIPIAVLAGTLLGKTRKILALALILISVFASASVIIYNVETAYTAASWSEYNAGIWIRNNTPERSVFLTYYSIDSPPTMIGGRLRVSCYFNWPYGQGTPYDDIVKRNQDIDRAFTGTETDLKEVISTYNVTFIYAGLEEQNNYQTAVPHFNGISWLKTVYSADGLYVYKVNL
jgi:hypothetical protein